MKNMRLLFLILISVFSLQCVHKPQHLVILHTNDLHSQIEPIKVSKYYNLGGMTRIAAIVDAEQRQNANVLMVDAGDFWQGTPYFNFYGGKVEIEMMNAIGYNAATLGNHQLDLPIDTLAERLKAAQFPVVLCNYDISKTALRDMVKPYVVINKENIKIGILGVCVDLENLAFAKNYEGMIYQDPIASANTTAALLKSQGCDFIVCLSHLGFDDNPGADDLALAENSKNINLIIGGHSHTFLEESVSRINQDGKPVTIVQMGKSGAHIGKVEVDL